MRIVWHRGDLRVHDHPALHAALRHGPVLGLVILDPAILDATSRRRRALFFRNVAALREAYAGKGGALLVRRGEPAQELARLADHLAGRPAGRPAAGDDPLRVHALASFTPYGVARDTAATEALRSRGVGIRWHDGLYVHSPGTVRTGDDAPYSVFSPFFRRWRGLGTPDPLPPPDAIPAPPGAGDLDPGEVPDEDPGLELPAPGEGAALDALERFVAERLPDYAERRDRLDAAATSHLSVWITLGVLSARTAAARVEGAAGSGHKWLAELAWRDFLADLLFHRPDLLDHPFQPRWRALDWPGDEERWEAWRDGRTGVPAVDAAMRQLRRTGWIGNRARMVAAQFLAKNLRVDWRRGERLFRRWLLDGDTASNVGNWQWAAGLGIDNAPYFRVMNPTAQAEKHDPDGAWVRRWTEADDDDAPAAAPAAPVVDLAGSRAAYLDAAGRVPPAAEAPDPPEPPRPPLALATDARLATVPGIGPATAARVLDALAAGPHRSLEELPGMGAALGQATRRRFAVDR